MDSPRLPECVADMVGMLDMLDMRYMVVVVNTGQSWWTW